MSRPVTGKDMDSFARQLDNIGNQMRDLAVASRMETLSTRTRRLIDSHIRPLEGRKVRRKIRRGIAHFNYRQTEGLLSFFFVFFQKPADSDIFTEKHGRIARCLLASDLIFYRLEAPV